jgi:hypothetical protein
MDTTGKALIDPWGWATKHGLMNANTAGSLRAACAKVLSIFENLETVDVRTLDVDETLRRFKNLRGKDLKPDSIAAYDQRFRFAVKSFLDYVDDPAAWKPNTRAPERNGRSKAKESGAQPGANGSAVSPTTPASGGGISYPFPLLDGFVAQLVLPKDLKTADIKRMATFMSTLVVEEAPTPLG